MNSKFLRQDSSIYALMSDGYRKGHEQFKNRVSLHFNRDASVPEIEFNNLIEKVLNFLNENNV